VPSMAEVWRSWRRCELDAAAVGAELRLVTQPIICNGLCRGRRLSSLFSVCEGGRRRVVSLNSGLPMC
jgi:hypothetical protein